MRRQSNPGRFARRWLIEVCFRDSKQLLGLNDPQNGWSRGVRRKKRPKPGPQPRGNRGRKAAERTTPFVWIVYGITVGIASGLVAVLFFLALEAFGHFTFNSLARMPQPAPWWTTSVAR